MFTIKNGQLMMYDVSKEYKNYLRKYDSKVSLKDDRKFYGILITNNGIDYCIPFTSRVDKKTNSRLTINIKHQGKIIAKLLINNMIPVNYKDCSIVNVNTSKYKDYYMKELQYLRNPNVISKLLEKVENVYNIICNKEDKNYTFFSSICCNFPLLEEKCKEWNKVS